MSSPSRRTSWWGDLAATCAEVIARRPAIWLVGLAAVTFVARPETGGVVALSTACAAIVAALSLRSGLLRVRPRFPGLATAAALVAYAVAGGSDPSERSLGFLVGAAVVFDGVLARVRLPPAIGLVLVWGGIVVARGSQIVAASRGSVFGPRDVFALGAWEIGGSVALAAAALMLLPRDHAEPGAPRRAGVGALRWFHWFVVPALALALPLPGTSLFAPGTNISFFGSLVVVAFAVRTAHALVEDTTTAADPGRRLLRAYHASPWTACIVHVLLAAALSSVVRRGVGAAVWSAPGGPEVYAANLAQLAVPDALLCATAAYALIPLRRLPRSARTAPWLCVLLLTPAIGVTWLLVPALVGDIELSQASEYLLSAGQLVYAVPLVVGRVLAARSHAFGRADWAWLVAALLIPAWIEFIWDADHLAGHAALLTQLSGAVVYSALFVRAATLTVRGWTLVIGTALMAVAVGVATIVPYIDFEHPTLPRPGRLPLPSLASWNQLRIVPALLIGWMAALIPLGFARLLLAARDEAAEDEVAAPEASEAATSPAA